MASNRVRVTFCAALVAAIAVYGAAPGAAGDAERSPEALVNSVGAMNCELDEGPFGEILARVRREPESFAPHIRDQLLRLPATLEEFIENPHGWSVSDPPNGVGSGIMVCCMRLVENLGREHAEPILREFYDRTLPLALDASAQSADFRDQMMRGERPPDQAELTQIVWLNIRLRSAAAAAGRVARNLDSPIFVDDAIRLLQSDRREARSFGAAMAGYVLRFAAERPDVVQILHNVVAVLDVSDHPNDTISARLIRVALNNFDSPESD